MGGDGSGRLGGRRLRHALRHGDGILAVIRGSAVNQDGASGGLTVPNGPSQQEVIRQALKVADIQPEQVGYVEAHGTGTSLGDPIEVQALAAALCQERDSNQPLRIGSVKTNFGHLESAAGIAGVIKTVLCLHHRELPAHLNFDTPNPRVPWDDLPIEVVRERQTWDDEQRIAGVSAFAFSGTNAHVVLESAPAAQPTEQDHDQPVAPSMLKISGRTELAVRNLAERYANWLDTHHEVNLAEVCHTLNVGRADFEHRSALTVESVDQAREQLMSLAGTTSPDDIVHVHGETGIAFMFTGQGSQYVGMASKLYSQEPRFREAFDRGAQLLADELDTPLMEVIQSVDGPLNQTAFTQPALFVLQMALVELWSSWGIKPSVVLGHSVGQFAAACTAGVMSWEDGLRLIATRGRLMQSLPQGGCMAAVMAGESTVADAIAGVADVGVAAFNGAHTVISGPTAQVTQVIEQLEQKGVRAQRLNTSHAFHSVLMEPILDEFARVVSETRLHAPTIHLICNLTGQLVDSERIQNPAYWCHHIRHPVQFARSMETLATLGCQSILELGPHPVLVGMAQQAWPAKADKPAMVASIRRGIEDDVQIVSALGELYRHGATCDFRGLHADQTMRKLAMPTYPFERSRYWYDAPKSGLSQTSVVGSPTQHPLLGSKLRLASAAQTCFEQTLTAQHPKWIGDHRVFDFAVFPAAGYVELALAAARALDRPSHLSQLIIREPLAIDPQQHRRLQTVITPIDADQMQVEVFSQDENEEGWTLHAQAVLREGSSASPTNDLQSALARCNEPVDVDSLYEQLDGFGLPYGPRFRTLKNISIGNGELVADISLSDEEQAAGERYLLHPALLDGCLQSLAALSDRNETMLPVAVDSIQLYASSTTQVRCHARISTTETGAPAAEVTLIDTEGGCVGQLSGIKLRPASRAALARRFGKQSTDDLVYELTWRELMVTDPVTTSEQDDRQWIVLGRDSALTSATIGQLRSRYERCVWLEPSEFAETVDRDHCRIDTGDAESIDRALLSMLPQSADTRCMFVVVADESQEPEPAAVSNHAAVSPDEALLHRIQNQTAPALSLVQAIARANTESACSIWLVTQAAQRVIPSDQVDVAANALWGFGRVAAQEYPQLHCRLMDLPADFDDGRWSDIVSWLAAGVEETQWAWRDGKTFTARLVRTASRLSPPDDDWQLVIPERGMLENLTMVNRPQRDVGPDEVRLRVRACGLNFRDVLNALGMYPGDPGPLGGECAGEVIEVGRNVDQVQPGDRVMAFAAGCMASTVIVPATLVAPLPDDVSDAEAAGLPIVFSTVMYAFDELAELKPGERVLIHAAAGGVGLAAIQMAQARGAEIYATASPGKWQFLRQMGVKHLFNSRTLDFKQQLLDATGGEGVHVVLNSLSGDFIPCSLDVVSQGGRFVEIGKRGIWSAEQVREQRADVQYDILAVDHRLQEQPDKIGQTLRELADALARGDLKPIHHTTFPITEAVSTFRWMQQARHVGKIVLRVPPRDVVRCDGNYLITGGLGALGIETARHLIDRGARYVTLVGRRKPSGDVEQQIDAWRSDGISVRVAQADVSRHEDVQRLIAELPPSAPPLRGIVHAAGILDDGVVSEQSWERFERVMTGKVKGAHNLLTVADHTSLDFCVLYSSMASLIGSAGQSNYAAANACLDAMALNESHRGQPVVSLNWGPWNTDGMAADNAAAQARWQAGGITPLDAESNFEVLDAILNRGVSQAMVASLDWKRLGQTVVSAAFQNYLEDLLQDAASAPVSTVRIAELLQNVPADERESALVKHLQSELQQVLSLTTAPDAQQGFFDMGMDSLMGVELYNRLQLQLGELSLSTTVVFDYPNAAALAGHILSEMVQSNAFTVEDKGSAVDVGAAASSDESAPKDPAESAAATAPTPHDFHLRMVLGDYDPRFIEWSQAWLDVNETFRKVAGQCENAVKRRDGDLLDAWARSDNLVEEPGYREATMVGAQIAMVRALSDLGIQCDQMDAKGTGEIAELHLRGSLTQEEAVLFAFQEDWHDRLREFTQSGPHDGDTSKSTRVVVDLSSNYTHSNGSTVTWSADFRQSADEAVQALVEVLKTAGYPLSASAANSPVCAATVEATAPRAERSLLDSVPDSELMVQLRYGDDEAPLFLLHDFSGSVMPFYALGRLISSNRSVFGIRTPRLDFIPRDIDELASRYRQAILNVNPDGPFTIGSWSLGGPIALAVAQQLIDRDHTDVRVALLDALACAKDMYRLIRAYDTRLAQLVEYLSSIDDAHIEEGSRTNEEMSRLIGELQRERRLPLDFDPRRSQSNIRLMRDFEATSCEAEVALFCAGDSLPGVDDSAADRGWKEFCADLTVIETPGNHFTMLNEPHVFQLAELINDWLAERSKWSVTANGALK